MNNYKKFSKLRNKSSTFCILPFTHLNLQIHGNNPKASSCWEQMTLADNITDNYSVKDAWNSKIFCDIRKDTLSNKRHDACQQCWALEDSGANGFRIPHLRSYINPYDELHDDPTKHDEGCFDILETYNFETGEIGFSNLPFIELRFGRQCNLMCRMCHAGESSQWDLGLRQNKELYDWTINNGPYTIPPPYSPIVERELLKKQIDIIIDSCKDSIRTIMFAGGEPLLSKDHYTLLEKLQPNAHNIRLKYSSNFNILNIKKYNLFKLWKSFRAVEVKISHDVDPHVYNYLRYKGDYEIVRENIEDLHKENLSNVEYNMFCYNKHL